MSNSPAPVPQSDAKWRAIALVCLPLVGILLVILAIFLIRPRDAHVVVYRYADGQYGAPSVNRGAITDAVADPSAAPRLGYRYRVFVEDESDDRSSGIARIGGRATFIPDARRGQTAIVDVTRVRPNVVDAILVRVVSETVLPPKPARESYKPDPSDAAAMVVDDAEFDVLVTEPSSKNPDSECIARVAGLVVVVDQPLPVGQRVNIRVTERRERIAFATPTGKPAGAAPLAPTSSPRRNRPPRAAAAAPATTAPAVAAPAAVKPVATAPVAVAPVATAPVATAPVATAPVATAPVAVAPVATTPVATTPVATAPVATAPVAIVPVAVAPVAAAPVSAAPATPAATVYPVPERVLPGEEYDVVILEPSKKNPATESVAKIDGLVVFVRNPPPPGTACRVRILERRARNAVAEVVVPAPAPAVR